MASKARDNTDFDWQKQLRQPLLPADPSVKQAAIQKLQSPTGNAKNVAALLTADPALCLLLICETNKSLALSDTECQSLAHAISLLGVPQTEALLRKAPEQDPKHPHLKQYRRLQRRSLHAAFQAQAWTELNPYWAGHKVFWPTLLQQAPLWALWYHAGDTLGALPSHVPSHVPSQFNNIEAFGASLNDITTTLSKRWLLPELSQLSRQREVIGDTAMWAQLHRLDTHQAANHGTLLEEHPKLQQLCSRAGFLIALANSFAEAVDLDWYSRHSLRLMTILAAACQRDTGQVIAHCHQLAAEFSRERPNRELPNPAHQLLCFYQEPPPTLQHADQNEELLQTATQPPPATTNDSHTALPSKTRQSASNKALDHLLDGAPATFVDQITRLQTHADSFKDVHEVMTLAVNTLCESLGLERATASLLNIKNRDLRTYYSCGANDSPALKNFRHPLRKGDLFNKLLQKPVSVRLQSSNYPQLWPLLPGNFKQACGADEFVMMSIFIHQKPFALLYADCGINNRPINGQQYGFFKMLCSAVSDCLQQLADR